MQFNYLINTTTNASLEIEDIGNSKIQAFDDIGNEYYLVIKTALGWTEIFEFGPILRDLQELPPKVGFSYQRIEYNERKIAFIINRFLNEHDVTQAFIIDKDEAKKYMRNLVDYI